MGDYVFRTVPSDLLQGDFAAKRVSSDGLKKAATFYTNEPYGKGLSAAFEESFKKLGGEVVSSESVERGSTDLRTQVTKIKSANPEVVFIAMNSPDSAVKALQQLKELGVNAKLYGSEGLADQSLIDKAGSSAEGLVVNSVTPGNDDFAAKFKAEYKEDPGAFAAQAYDAYKAVALAVEQGAKTGAQIKEKLNKLEFEGATGKIKFDEKGDVPGNYVVYVVTGGKLVLQG